MVKNSLVAGFHVLQLLHLLVAGLAESIRAQTIDADDLVEMHECLALCLRGYNDVLFNLTCLPDRRMLPHEKEVLKRERLGYITRLIEPRKVLRPHIDQLRKRVLRMLPPASDDCETLHEGWKQWHEVCNRQQHPIPDHATAFRRIGDLGTVDLDTLQVGLRTVPYTGTAVF
ncbi:hypothetical protein B0H13DRAFT_2370082 [Mycena leptocephala]|nr:hypothetical protein B0H13DRAFT_2370082 [Mycena leptocephala]